MDFVKFTLVYKMFEEALQTGSLIAMLRGMQLWAGLHSKQMLMES